MLLDRADASSYVAKFTLGTFDRCADCAQVLEHQILCSAHCRLLLFGDLMSFWGFWNGRLTKVGQATSCESMGSSIATESNQLLKNQRLAYRIGQTIFPNLFVCVPSGLKEQQVRIVAFGVRHASTECSHQACEPGRFIFCNCVIGMHRPLTFITASHSPNAVVGIQGAEEAFSTESALSLNSTRSTGWPHRLGLDFATRRRSTCRSRGLRSRYCCANQRVDSIGDALDALAKLQPSSSRRSSLRSRPGSGRG